jgi:hypothetical protein
MRSLVSMAMPIIAVVIGMRSPISMAVPMAIPIIVAVMVMPPGPIRIPVRAVIAGAHDHGRRDYDWRRNPDAHRHAHSGVGQER